MLLLVIQESCKKRPTSDVRTENKRLFLFLEQANTGEVAEKSKDVILELNCDVPCGGSNENVHVCKSNKPI